MLDKRERTKIKNNKIELWKIKLASFSYDIQYCPGKDNVAPDAFKRAFCASMPDTNIVDVHNGLCHPGVTQMLHFIRSKNLPFSTEDVRKVCSSCKICAELELQITAIQLLIRNSSTCCT